MVVLINGFPIFQIRLLERLLESDAYRQELVIEFKKARSTVFDNLDKLRGKKLLEKYDKPNGGRGRPLVYWKLTKKGIEIIQNIKTKN